MLADRDRHGLRTVIAAGLSIACVIALVWPNARRVDYLMVGALVAQLEQRIGQRVRVHGFVGYGSVDTQAHTFELVHDGKRLRVYHGDVPAPREGAEVVVNGRVTGLGLDTVDVIMRCDDRYRGEKHGQARFE